MYFHNWSKVFVLFECKSEFLKYAKSIVGLTSRFVVVFGLLHSMTGCIFNLSEIINRRLDIDSLTNIIRSYPNDPEGYNVRGVIYGRHGDFKKALQDFQTALNLNPMYYKAYVNRASIFCKIGDFASALRDYDSALKINPNYGMAYIGRGDLYRKKGYSNPKKALENFNNAIQLGNPDAGAFHGRALVYQTLGDHEKAIVDFSQAMSLSSLSPDHYNGRGLSYLAIKNYDSAMEDFKIAASLDSTIPDSWFNQGLAYEIQQDYRNAIECYKKSLAVDSGYTKARNGISRVMSILHSN